MRFLCGCKQGESELQSFGGGPPALSGVSWIGWKEKMFSSHGGNHLPLGLYVLEGLV